LPSIPSVMNLKTNNQRLLATIYNLTVTINSTSRREFIRVSTKYPLIVTLLCDRITAGYNMTKF